jgi:hypothetical protein
MGTYRLAAEPTGNSTSCMSEGSPLGSSRTRRPLPTRLVARPRHSVLGNLSKQPTMLDFGNEVIRGACLLKRGVGSDVTVVGEWEMGISNAEVTLYICCGRGNRNELVPPGISVEGNVPYSEISRFAFIVVVPLASCLCFLRMLLKFSDDCKSQWGLPICQWSL